MSTDRLIEQLTSLILREDVWYSTVAAAAEVVAADARFNARLGAMKAAKVKYDYLAMLDEYSELEDACKAALAEFRSLPDIEKLTTALERTRDAISMQAARLPSPPSGAPSGD
jgi:hypothetical protein